MVEWGFELYHLNLSPILTHHTLVVRLFYNYRRHVAKECSRSRNTWPAKGASCQIAPKPFSDITDTYSSNPLIEAHLHKNYNMNPAGSDQLVHLGLSGPTWLPMERVFAPSQETWYMGTKCMGHNDITRSDGGWQPNVLPHLPKDRFLA